MRIFFLIIGLVASLASWAQSNTDNVAVEHLKISQPREFGYQLGDLFERHLSLRLRRPYEFVEDSLPQPSRLNRWIAFHSYDLKTSNEGASVAYEITLRYQVANVEKTITDAGVPSHQLKISNGDETLTFLVPPSRTTIAPFGGNPSGELAADKEPELVPLENRNLAMLAAALLISLLGVWWFQWGIYRRKDVAPFNHCYQQLKAFRDRPLSEQDYAGMLREIHHAFNQTAGRAVFPESLAEFVTQHQNFAPVQSRIDEYFAHSNDYFFGDREADMERYTVQQLRDFLQQCCKAERRGK